MGVTKYCCCCFDLLVGVKIIGIVLTLFNIIGLIASIVIRAYFKQVIGTYVCIGFGFAIGVNLLLVSGASQRKRVYLLPW